jgi:endonuclease III
MDGSNNDLQVRQSHIATLLLANRGGGMDWGEFSRLDGKPWSKKLANTFLLCCLLDYQIPSEVAWRNGYRLIEDILGDPDDVWRAITSVTDSEWKSKRDEYKLHRFPVGHNRLWRIGRRICDKYEGDARHIWKGKYPPAALEMLSGLGAGDQISRMVVGALRDCGQLTGATSDVKGDVYVRRVLGRAVLGEPTDPEMAVRLARQLHPTDPWQLDAQLWYVGKSYCHAGDPTCSQCYLAPHCAYALKRSQDGSPK